MHNPARWRTALYGLTVACSYFLMARLGNEFARLYDGYAPFWPAAGAASGALMVLGLHYAPAIAAGSLAASAAQGYPLLAAPWFAAVDTAEALLVASLVRRAGLTSGLRRPAHVVQLAGMALAGGAISATMAAPMYAAVAPAEGATGWSLWSGWTLGNAIGHLIVGGGLLVWAAPQGPARPRASGLEQGAIAAGTAVVSSWIFLAPGPAWLQHPYLLLALVTWAAVRLGQRAVSLTLVIGAALAAWGVTRGTGPFSPREGFTLQVFLGVCSLAGFGVAAVAAAREEMASLRAQDARYRILADASPNLMWSGSAEGSIDFFNQHACRYTGLTPDQASHLGWFGLVHPDDRSRTTAAWRAAAAEGGSCALEVRVRHADGAYRWHWAVAVPTFDGSATEPRWIGTATDIHDRKLAELELASWRTHYERAQAVGQLGSWESEVVGEGSDGRLVWSSELFRIFGVRSDQFHGKVSEFYELVHPEDRARVREAVASALGGGHRYAIDHRIVRSDGEVRWVHEEGDVSQGLDGVRRMIGVCRDITERVRAEEERQALEQSLLQAQKLESLGILAGGIAHDFNNLLVGILGNASLALLDVPPDSPARPALERIETTSLRAADLIRQMLAYSGRGTLSMERVDVSALVREMGDLLGTAISKKAVLRYELGASLPQVQGDPTQLRQVVMNLITNASDALNDEGGTITVTTAAIGADDRRRAEVAGGAGAPEPFVQIRVTDTGVGMDPATQARIFDPFFSTKFTGRGLGLAAVQGIVRSHHGSIRVESAPGRGTTFTVLLPAVTASPDERASQSPAVSRLAHLFSGTVLVIDDEDPVRVAVGLMLERFGFTVIAAASGRQGLQYFDQHAEAIDLVILDLTMPDISGADVLAALRARGCVAPVLLVSGYGRSDAVRAAGTNAVAGFLQKPFKPQQLAEAVGAALAAHGRTAGRAASPGNPGGRS